jgi:hypothetical protein
MWNWFNCYVSGRHDYSIWCEPNVIYLRCVHCGRRSNGLNLKEAPVESAPPPTPISRIARLLLGA